MSPSQLKKIKTIFAKHGVRFAYLFGSRALGHARKSSDYDFAVYFGNGTNDTRFESRLTLMGALSSVCAPAEAQVIVLDDTRSIILRREVLRGATIYGKATPERVSFVVRTLAEYDDFLPFLNAYTKAYIRAAGI